MSILVFIEQREGRIRSVSHEVLGEASRLKASFGGEVIAVLPCASDPGAASLGASGADRVQVVTHEAFGVYDAAGCTRAMVQAIEQVKPAVVLFPASSLGKDLAPRVAARLGVGLASDCTSVAVVDGALVVKRPVFAGKAIQKIGFPRSPAIASLRPKVFAAGSAAGAGAVETAAANFDATATRARVVRTAAAAGGKVDLTESEIIVSGGRGMKGPEHFALIENLAEALGATVGASRAVVDAGWRPHSEQVGQTGKTVSPKLYIAVGVSGAIQHLAGMSSSRCIVAINKDPDAPIFKVADYGIVGDLFDVLPALTEAVKKLNAQHV